MDLYQTIFEVIDMRSFSNLWYWIALAVVWSTAAHFVLGVPFDLILRARRQGGQAETDMHDLVRININRILTIGRVAGLWIVALGSTALTVIGLLGFVYRVEFAQALFLLAFPLSVVGLMSVRAAAGIEASGATGSDLYHRLRKHRFLTQLVGMISILVTAIWGMYQNIVIGPFGS